MSRSDAQWANAEAEDEEALACLSGIGKCGKGTPGKVVLVKPSAADYKERERILKDFVLKNWAARCSAECIKDWNDTAAKVVGVMATK